jgi:amino acid transporter
MTADKPPSAAADVASSQPALRMFNMVLFSVCALLLLSQVTLTAEVGATSVFWTIAIIVLFFIPYGLTTAELGSTYPDTGGIYAWVVRAFGRRWGTRVSFWYWLNVALWVPSVYLMFSGALSSMFFGGHINFWVQVAIAVVLIWVNYWVNIRSLETGAWVSNLGAALTIVVIIAVAVAAGVFLGRTGGSATHWSLSSMLPQHGVSELALALPVIIYNFLGFELMSSASNQMANPKRDVPRAIFVAGLLVGGFYLLATIAMQVIVPAGSISSTTGLIHALRVGFGGSLGSRIVVDALGIASLYCFFALLIPWTIGANIAAAESAQVGDLPKIFGRTHPVRQTPTGAALLCAVVGTAVTLIYAVLSKLTNGSVDSLFWSLFAFSSVIFLLPYVVLMLSFLRLRKIDPDTPRPYRVPGGHALTVCTTWVPIVLLVAAAVFFVVNPWSFDWSTTGPILVGLAITFVIQEIFCAKAPAWAAARAAEAASAADSNGAAVTGTAPQDHIGAAV